jgi:hypothetical protein
MSHLNQHRSSAARGGLALCLALATTLVAAPAMAGKKDGAKATFVKGTVEVGKAEAGPFKKLKRNKQVTAGQFVRTGDASRAELTFPDGSILRIGPGSILHVKEAGFDSKTKAVSVDATVVGGKAWAKVSKLVGSDAKFAVKSKNAVAGVRGTIFRVNVDRDEATVVKVYDGAVAVSNSPFFADNKTTKSGDDLKPIRDDRKPIPAPFEEVSKKEWEQIVKRMMEVRVGPDGQMTNMGEFTAEQDKLEDPEWVNWNLACDKGDCSAY